MRMVDEGVTMRNIHLYEERYDVILDDLRPLRGLKAYTSSPPSRPEYWPLTVRGRLVGLTSREAAQLASGHKGGFQVAFRGRAYKFILRNKEGDFVGRSEW